MRRTERRHRLVASCAALCLAGCVGALSGVLTVRPSDLWYEQPGADRSGFVVELRALLGEPSVTLRRAGHLEPVERGLTHYVNPLGELVPVRVRAPGGAAYTGDLAAAPVGSGVVVALHQTNEVGGAEPCGDQPAADQAYGTYFAAQGSLVVCPTLSFTGERQPVDPWDTAAFYLAHPTWSAMGKDVTEVSWLLDALAAAGVEIDDLTLVGHSQGAMYAMYAAVLDERVDRVVANAGYVDSVLDPDPLRWSRPTWYRAFREVPVGLDQLEVVAAVAPRCALVVNYTADEVLGATVPARDRLAQLAGRFPSIEWVEVPGPHAWPDEQLAAAAAWLAHTPCPAA